MRLGLCATIMQVEITVRVGIFFETRKWDASKGLLQEYRNMSHNMQNLYTLPTIGGLILHQSSGKSTKIYISASVVTLKSDSHYFTEPELKWQQLSSLFCDNLFHIYYYQTKWINIGQNIHVTLKCLKITTFW